VQRTLEKISAGNIIQTEQYMDFIRNRYFRQTLLVKRERMGDIQRNIRAERLATFHLSANIKTQRDVNVTASTVATFESAQGRTMDVTEPIIKAALITLGQAYPRSVTFEGLFRSASELAQTSGTQQDTLLNALLALAVNGLLDLHAEPLAFAGAKEPQPRAFPVASQQASTGSTIVTNSRHEQVTLNVFQVALLGLLDGKRDLAALPAALTAKCLAGEISVQRDGQPINTQESLGTLMPGLISENLRLLEVASLLI
jgi:methyltransferase-like protein